MPPADDIMGMSAVVLQDNTESGTTSKTETSTTCEVDQGQQVDQPRQITSAIEAEDPMAGVYVAELQRTDPGAVSTISSCVKDGIVLSEAELRSSGSELCRLHSMISLIHQ